MRGLSGTSPPGTRAPGVGAGWALEYRCMTDGSVKAPEVPAHTTSGKYWEQRWVGGREGWAESVTFKLC